MKLQVTQENLAKAISAVARVAVSARNPLPILNNILLRTEHNRLMVSATNLEIAITEYIGAKVTKEGSVTLPAKLLQEFVSSLPSGTITIDSTDHKCTIESGTYHSVINGIVADEFPVVPKITNGTSLSLDATQLKKALQQVIIAASSDDTRPVLTGVYLHTFEKQLVAVATDSYRLAEKIICPCDQEIALLIPSNALNDLLRLIDDEAATVTLTTDSQQVVFTVGESELVSRLIDGSYPDYRKLLPKVFANSATLTKDDLVTVTKVSSLFARESAGSITLAVDEVKKQLTVSSVASQLGENRSSIEGTVEGSGELTINSRYLLDALNVMPVKQVTFSFNGKIEACILKSDQLTDYTHLIMPLKS